MWLRSKLTSLSDYLFKSLFRVLFRYDIFISYARGDGKDYAIKLRDQLKHLDFSCFLDLDELPPGNSLNNTLKRAIRKSATLVIVGTERAVKSNFVELEVAEFAGTGRAIVPIDIDGSMTEAPWSIIKERDIVWIDEAKSSLTKGVPSPNVADSIDKLFKYTRRNTRVRAQVLSTIALFVVVVIAALLMIRQQITAKTIAFDKAEQQQIVAEKASAEAKTQKATAVKAIEDATKERERADIALANAKTAEKAAEEAAKNAKKQEAIARINAELAKKQQLIAEERTNYLRAKQIGVQADIDIDKGDNLERSVLLSVESLKTALTPDGYIAWARGMDLLPQPVETKFRKEKDDVTAIAYSPDGRFFAQGTAEGRITFFRTEKSEPVERHLRSPIKAITFGKNWVAAANEREFVMWDLDKFVEIRSSKNLNGFRAELIAFSPDGRYVATAGPSTKGLLSVFDTANSSIVIRKLIEHVGYIMSLSFSPDGKWLALGCHYKSYEERGTAAVATTAEVFNQSASGGRIIFLAVENFAKGADIASKPVAWVPEDEMIYRITFGPMGEHLASEDMKGAVRIWQVVDSDPQIKLKRGQTQRIRSRGYSRNLGRATLVFSPDESYIATAPDENTARIWEVRSGNEVSRIMHDKEVEAIAFSPKGEFATDGGEVRFWKTEFRRVPKRLSFDTGSGDAELAAIAISPKREWLAIANKGRGVYVFSLTDWSQVTGLANTDQVSRLTVSLDGRWLVTADHDKVTMFDTSKWKVSKEIALQAPKKEEPKIGFSPDDQWLLVIADSIVHLFRKDSWQPGHSATHSDPVKEVFFSPNGKLLAVKTGGQRSSSRVRALEYRKRTYVWNLDERLLVACKTDEDTFTQSETKTTQSDPAVADCPAMTGKQQEALLSEIVNWRKSLELNPSSGTSPDSHWSVESNDRVELNFIEGTVRRTVATLTQQNQLDYWSFIQDSRWLLTAEGNTIGLWPLNSNSMIEEACKRLVRRDLTADEWKLYFAGEKLYPTCAPTRQ